MTPYEIDVKRVRQEAESGAEKQAFRGRSLACKHTGQRSAGSSTSADLCTEVC